MRSSFPFDKESKEEINCPDIHTEEGFKAFLQLPTNKVERIAAEMMAKAYKHFWDSVWIWRVAHIQNNCGKGCPKGCPTSFTGDEDEWKEADICSFSYTMANIFRTFIDSLMSDITEIEPPPVYPDLITVLKKIRDDLWRIIKKIDPDKDVIG